MSDFELYRPRKIEAGEGVAFNGWQIKVYTISINEKFQSQETFKAAIDRLDDFINKTTEGSTDNYKTAFLIIHEAREGVWILFYWWTGGEMLGSTVYFSDKSNPNVVTLSPHKVPLVCVWELEVIIHERAAWIKHILSQPKEPDFTAYLNDMLL